MIWVFDADGRMDNIESICRSLCGPKKNYNFPTSHFKRFCPRNTILRGRPNNFCDETSTNWKLLNDVPHPPPSSCPFTTTSLGVSYVVVAAVVRTHPDFLLLLTDRTKPASISVVGKYEPVNKERGLAGNSCISLQTAPTLLLTLY